MNDIIGDRMKMYESLSVNDRFLPLVPIIARIDGRAFHNFTRGMKKPYDPILSMVMKNTAKNLLEETGANIAYTQSDEISLIWLSENINSQVYFDGRISKMISQLAAQTTWEFNNELFKWAPDFYQRKATFDARVFTVPNKCEAANYILWREWDCTKNSISLAAQSFYSHKELQNKNGKEMQEMIFQKGINWNDYSADFKRGVYIQKRKVFRKFSAKELESLPEKHEARNNPNLIVERSDIVQIDMPIFSSVINKEMVIFNGADPIS